VLAHQPEEDLALLTDEAEALTLSDHETTLLADDHQSENELPHQTAVSIEPGPLLDEHILLRVTQEEAAIGLGLAPLQERLHTWMTIGEDDLLHHALIPAITHADLLHQSILIAPALPDRVLALLHIILDAILHLLDPTHAMEKTTTTRMVTQVSHPPVPLLPETVHMIVLRLVDLHAATADQLLLGPVQCLHTTEVALLLHLDRVVVLTALQETSHLHQCEVEEASPTVHQLLHDPRASKKDLPRVHEVVDLVVVIMELEGVISQETFVVALAEALL
jgi:hypothetical protein